MPADNNLHKAAHKGDIEECQKWIVGDGDDEPIDVNSPGASDRRALHRSAGAGHLELCEYFVSVGAVIDQPDKSGRTPLHWAAIAGHTEIVKFLLSKGANILAETANKMNALHGAVEGSKNDTVKALMDAVASDEGLKLSLCNAKNSDDKTSWDIAMGAKNQGLCTILKEMGDPNGASASCVIS